MVERSDTTNPQSTIRNLKFSQAPFTRFWLGEIDIIEN